MKKTVQKILPFVQFFPMALFWYIYKTSVDWVSAFKVGGAVAVVLLAATFFVVKRFDKILLSINLFLIGGAAMFLFNIGWLQDLYGYLDLTTPLVWFLVIGAVTTFLSPGGFIGFEQTENRKKVIGLSLVFLAAVCVAIFFSIYFKENLFHGIVLPWISLMILKDFLLGDHMLAGISAGGFSLLFFLKNGGFNGAIFVWIGLKVVKSFLKVRRKS